MRLYCPSLAAAGAATSVAKEAVTSGSYTSHSFFISFSHCSVVELDLRRSAWRPCIYWLLISRTPTLRRFDAALEACAGRLIRINSGGDRSHHAEAEVRLHCRASLTPRGTSCTSSRCRRDRDRCGRPCCRLGGMEPVPPPVRRRGSRSIWAVNVVESVGVGEPAVLLRGGPPAHETAGRACRI